ncbi:MAG: AbrB/MazE/SpoVT family DNA-binding domain-containing protein [Vicinamibacterales bacterium]|nr:AbrB/MazE/SpoVT family DNA-binding domain-containing protein [Vicinamibacterales bacterium]
MELVKLGKSGQVSIPRAILRRLGISGEQAFLVDTTPDGAIVLKQAGVYPIEVYSDDRIREFDDDDRLTPAEVAKLKQARRKKR